MSSQPFNFSSNMPSSSRQSNATGQSGFGTMNPAPGQQQHDAFTAHLIKELGDKYERSLMDYAARNSMLEAEINNLREQNRQLQVIITDTQLEVESGKGREAYLRGKVTELQKTHYNPSHVGQMTQQFQNFGMTPVRKDSHLDLGWKQLNSPDFPHIIARSVPASEPRSETAGSASASRGGSQDSGNTSSSSRRDTKEAPKNVPTSNAKVGAYNSSAGYIDDVHNEPSSASTIVGPSFGMQAHLDQARHNATPANFAVGSSAFGQPMPDLSRRQSMMYANSSVSAARGHHPSFGQPHFQFPQNTTVQTAHGASHQQGHKMPSQVAVGSGRGGGAASSQQGQGNFLPEDNASRTVEGYSSLHPRSSSTSSATVKPQDHSSQQQSPAVTELVRTELDDEEKFDFAMASAEIMKMIKVWARNYASEPQARDRQMTEEMKQAMNAMANNYMVQTYLADASIRPLMIARYVIEVATREWRSNVVKGFENDPDLCAQIASARETIKKGALSLSDKAALFTMQKDAVKKMRQHSGFKAFLQWKATNSAQHLFKKVTPFLSYGVLDSAHLELRQIWWHVYKVGVAMLCTTCDYRFDFIKPGQNALWNPTAMVNVDRRFQHSNEQIAKMDLKVDACLTPVILMTEMVSDTISPKTIHKAEVLLHHGQ